MDFSKSDKKWRTFNRRLEKQMADGDLFGIGTTYYEMAYFLKGEGRPYKHLLDKGFEMKKKSMTYQLKSYRGGIVSSVEAIVTSTACPQCMANNQKKQSLDEALVSPPLPIKDCTFEPYGCRCVFEPSI